MKLNEVVGELLPRKNYSKFEEVVDRDMQRGLRKVGTGKVQAAAAGMQKLEKGQRAQGVQGEEAKALLQKVHMLLSNPKTANRLKMMLQQLEKEQAIQTQQQAQ